MKEDTCGKCLQVIPGDESRSCLIAYKQPSAISLTKNCIKLHCWHFVLVKFRVQAGADLPDEPKECVACRHYYHVVQRVIQYWKMWSQFRGHLGQDCINLLFSCHCIDTSGYLNGSVQHCRSSSSGRTAFRPAVS